MNLPATQQELESMLTRCARQAIALYAKDQVKGNWLTPSQTMAMLNIESTALWELESIGAVKANKKGKGKQFDRASIEKYLRNPGAWDQKKREFKNR